MKLTCDCVRSRAPSQLEYNPAMRISFPHGILMLVGEASRLIGTPKADRLREWCIQRGWPLSWSFDPYPLGGPPCLDTQDPGSRSCFENHAVLTDYTTANVRLLDPAVLRAVPHGHNLTGATDNGAFGRAGRTFELMYNRSRQDGDQPTNRDWANLLRAPDMVQLAIEPVYARACADDRCVGVRVSDGSCVCP